MWHLQSKGNWEIACGLELYPGDHTIDVQESSEPRAKPTIDNHPHAKRRIINGNTDGRQRYISELSLKEWNKLNASAKAYIGSTIDWDVYIPRIRKMRMAYEMLSLLEEVCQPQGIQHGYTLLMKLANIKRSEYKTTNEYVAGFQSLIHECSVQDFMSTDKVGRNQQFTFFLAGLEPVYPEWVRLKRQLMRSVAITDEQLLAVYKEATDESTVQNEAPGSFNVRNERQRGRGRGKGKSMECSHCKKTEHIVEKY